MANKQKYYVVWNGRKKGIFLSWEECKQSIDKFANASYKSFESREEAEIAFKKGYKPVSTTKKNPQTRQTNANTPEIIRESLAVDAACSGNPGNMEYRGVYVKTGQEIFKMGPF
ncbi:MAG: ribonuclease H family protein, partial [Bacteroidales bacterium]|nr:ribonuclease H family protein [Bacteroidales bacterium]